MRLDGVDKARDMGITHAEVGAQLRPPIGTLVHLASLCVGKTLRGQSISAAVRSRLWRLLDTFSTAPYLRSCHPSIKAHPAKAGAAKPRVLASSATPPPDASKDPKTAELPT